VPQKEVEDFLKKSNQKLQEEMCGGNSGALLKEEGVVAKDKV